MTSQTQEPSEADLTRLYGLVQLTDALGGTPIGVDEFVVLTKLVQRLGERDVAAIAALIRRAAHVVEVP